MKNVLIIGGTSVTPREKMNIEALLLRQMGYDVTVHFTAKDSDEIEIQKKWLDENGIVSYGEISDQIDWERLGKELKTHQNIIVKTNSMILPALDFAKVYGRDVWCAIDLNSDSAFIDQCDYTFRLDTTCEICESVNKMCVTFKPDGSIHYFERDIDSRNYKIEVGTSDWSTFDLGVFMCGFIYAFDKGEYTDQCLKYGLAVQDTIKKGTTLDIENLISISEVPLQALE
jgi:hypothetical protein